MALPRSIPSPRSGHGAVLCVLLSLLLGILVPAMRVVHTSAHGAHGVHKAAVPGSTCEHGERQDTAPPPVPLPAPSDEDDCQTCLAIGSLHKTALVGPSVDAVLASSGSGPAVRLPASRPTVDAERSPRRSRAPPARA